MSLECRPCDICSQTFQPRAHNARYCDGCQPAARARHEEARRRMRLVKRCKSCGGAKSAADIYCSDCKRERAARFQLTREPRSAWERTKLPQRLPVEPLYLRVRAFIDKHAELNEQNIQLITPMAEMLGLGERRYSDWKRGVSLYVSLAVADRILTAAGWDWDDVWTRETAPELFDALDAIDALGEAEADGFCEVCMEWVATVNGCCPWHEKPVPAVSSEPFTFEGPDGSLSEMAA